MENNNNNKILILLGEVGYIDPTMQSGRLMIKRLYGSHDIKCRLCLLFYPTNNKFSFGLLIIFGVTKMQAKPTLSGQNKQKK